jgi:hypothetical protein
MAQRKEEMLKINGMSGQTAASKQKPASIVENINKRSSTPNIYSNPHKNMSLEMRLNSAENIAKKYKKGAKPVKNTSTLAPTKLN